MFHFGDLPSLAELLQNYGYIVLFIGTLLGGASVLVLAGFFAQCGYMSLPLVIGCAFIGSLTSGQAYFSLGRFKGDSLLDLFEAWKPKIQRITGLMERYGKGLLLGFRFTYGLRTIIPFALGMSNIPTFRFAVYNVFGALIWSVVVGYAGYLFGSTVKAFF